MTGKSDKDDAIEQLSFFQMSPREEDKPVRKKQAAAKVNQDKQSEDTMTIQEKENKIDFEASLSELEKVVRELDGEIKLDKALNLFEQGIKLSVQCEQFIKGAEQKIEILKKQADGSLAAEPFEAETLD